MLKKKKEEVDENKFILDKDSMKSGKPDAKPPISIIKFIKKKLLFMLLFLIIVAAITTYLIVATNRGSLRISKQIKESTEVIEKTKYKTTNRNEWFYLNQIGYEKKNAKGDNYNLEYYEIDGLADSKTQNTINNLIIKKENTIFDEIRKQYPNANNYEIKANIIGNFANILSIQTTIDVKINSEQHIRGNRFFTINLIDGNDVNIEDIINNDDLKLILLDYGYYNFAEKYIKLVETPQTRKEFDSKNASGLEEEAYYFANEVINHSSKVSIGVSSSKVFISYPQNMKDEIYTRTIEIPLNEINGKDIIYNRYIEQNIYNSNYEKIGPFPVYMDSSNIYNVNYQKGDNYFIDLVIEKNNEIDIKEYDESYARVVNYMDKMAKEILTKASNDKTRFYYLTAYVTISPEGNNINASINGVNNNFLTKELFEDVVYNSFIKTIQSSNELKDAFKYTPDVGSPSTINKTLVINKAGDIV